MWGLVYHIHVTAPLFFHILRSLLALLTEGASHFRGILLPSWGYGALEEGPNHHIPVQNSPTDWEGIVSSELRVSPLLNPHSCLAHPLSPVTLISIYPLTTQNHTLVTTSSNAWVVVVHAYSQALWHSYCLRISIFPRWLRSTLQFEMFAPWLMTPKLALVLKSVPATLQLLPPHLCLHVHQTSENQHVQKNTLSSHHTNLPHSSISIYPVP